MHEHAGCKRRYIVDVKGTGDTSVPLILRRKYMGELKQHQPSMSIDEQVENLKSLEFICRPNRSINTEV